MLHLTSVPHRQPSPKSGNHASMISRPTSSMHSSTSSLQPPYAAPWKWECHLCLSRWPLSIGRRCLHDGHTMCSGRTIVRGRNGVLMAKYHDPCNEVFDYDGWGDFADWRRRVEMEAALAAGERLEGKGRKGKDCWNECDFPEQCRYMDLLESGADAGHSRRTSSSSGSSSYSDPMVVDRDAVVRYVDQHAASGDVEQPDVEMVDPHAHADAEQQDEEGHSAANSEQQDEERRSTKEPEQQDEERRLIAKPQQDDGVHSTAITQQVEEARSTSVSPASKSRSGTHSRQSSFLEHLDEVEGGNSPKSKSARSTRSKFRSSLCKRLRSIGKRAVRALAWIGPDVFILPEEAEWVANQIPADSFMSIRPH